MNPAIGSTREQLLEAAVDLLQRVGYASFSFRDLAEVVGIRTASIHYHFPTKADLGIALIDFLREYTRAREREMRDQHPDVCARLLALADRMAEKCADQRSCPMNILQAEYAVLPPAMQQALHTLIDEKLQLIGAWLEEGRAAGQLRFPGSAIVQAQLVWSVIEYGSQLARSHPDRSLQALVRQLVDTMSPAKSP